MENNESRGRAIVKKNCDERVHGALRLWGTWSMVMTKAKEHCNDRVMVHIEERGHSAL